ncbi:MAG TPA: cell shape determination protein CcmA [Firmicutes bacterium]|jgi:cytoskeletal protein CcmA (bactofilin family)|nr:cell shape determination protein CcmA [Bacillota bacterium]
MQSHNKEGINSRKVDTLVGKECSFKGNLEAPGGALRIDGYYEGELHIGGDLIVGESGKVAGNLVARNIIIAGEVKGTIEARGRLELAPTAKVIGDSKMVTLVVEDGAFLQGLCAPLPRGELKERGKALRVDTPVEA